MDGSPGLPEKSQMNWIIVSFIFIPLISRKFLYLCLRMYQAYSLLVNCNQEQFRIIWISGLFHFKKGRSKSWPSVDDFKETDFGIFWTHSRILVVRSYNVTFPIGGRHHFDQVGRNQFAKHLRNHLQFLLRLTEFHSINQGC